MNTAEIISIIIAGAGLVITIVAALLKLNSTITKLISSVDNLDSSFAKFSTSNTESHRRLWEHNDEQDKKLSDHEYRIHRLEGKRK